MLSNKINFSGYSCLSYSYMMKKIMPKINKFPPRLNFNFVRQNKNNFSTKIYNFNYSSKYPSKYFTTKIHSLSDIDEEALKQEIQYLQIMKLGSALL